MKRYLILASVLLLVGLFTYCQGTANKEIEIPNYSNQEDTGKSDSISSDAKISGALKCGQTIEADFINGTKFTGYHFFGREDDVVSIKLSSESRDADPILYLYPPSTLTGNLWRRPVILNDDDEVTGEYNSAIREYELKKNGKYLIVVSEHNLQDNTPIQAKYTLSLDCACASRSLNPCPLGQWCKHDSQDYDYSICYSIGQCSTANDCQWQDDEKLIPKADCDGEWKCEQGSCHYAYGQNCACSVNPDDYDHGSAADFNPHKILVNDQLFPLTVQAGAMTTESVILWGYTTDNLQKQLLVWRETDTDQNPIMVKDLSVTPKERYIKEQIGGLAPGTWYHYCFVDGPTNQPSSRSLIGRFRTAIPEDCMEPLTIGGTHGTKFKYAPYDVLKIAARRTMDLFFQLGDFSYNDGAESREEFRQKWYQTLKDPGYLALLPLVGQYVVWDDHEVVNDNELYDYITEKPHLIKNGIDAFFENVVNPRHENGSYWRSYKWGRTAEVFVLDTRFERVPETRKTDNAIFLSREQMNWLKDGLLNTNAHFKLILNSVPIHKLTTPPWIAVPDRWEGFDSQREELLNFIVDNDIPNVWFFTGETHIGVIATVGREGRRRQIWEIGMGPGGNCKNQLWTSYKMGLMRNAIAPDNQFLFFYGHQNATTMTLDPLNDTIRLEFIGEDEEVLFDRIFSYRDTPPE
jgi:phosphodiesterase/alkaline phosphatase D-like protein